MKFEHIVKGDGRTIFEDKVFIKKFLLLMLLIIALSSYLIYHSIHSVNEMATLSHTQKSSAALTLGVVEREVNGNTINLEVIEDDFSDLAEMDLSELMRDEQGKRSLSKTPIQAATSIAASSVGAVIQKREPLDLKAIEITSSPLPKAKKRDSIAFIKKKFYATNNASFAMKLSQKFYERKKYKKALKWALIANEVDAKNPKSWILFAKAKVALKKRQDAINALEAYLQMHTSKEVAKFLKTLRQRS